MSYINHIFHLGLPFALISTLGLAQDLDTFRARADELSKDTHVTVYKAAVNPHTKVISKGNNKRTVVQFDPSDATNGGLKDDVYYSNHEWNVCGFKFTTNIINDVEMTTGHRQLSLRLGGLSLATHRSKTIHLSDLFNNEFSLYKDLCPLTGVFKNPKDGLLYEYREGKPCPVVDREIIIHTKFLGGDDIEYVTGVGDRLYAGRQAILFKGKILHQTKKQMEVDLNFFTPTLSESSKRIGMGAGLTLRDFVDVGLVDSPELTFARVREKGLIIDVENAKRSSDETRASRLLNPGQVLPPFVEGGKPVTVGSFNLFGRGTDSEDFMEGKSPSMVPPTFLTLQRHNHVPIGALSNLTSDKWVYAGMHPDGRTFINVRFPLHTKLGVLIITKYQDERTPRVAYLDTSGVIVKIEGETAKFGLMREANSDIWGEGIQNQTGTNPLFRRTKALSSEKRRFHELTEELLKGRNQFLGPDQSTYGKRIEKQYTESTKLEMPLALY